MYSKGKASQCAAYVDESGCMGMRLHRNSSKFFGVAATLFEKPEAATECYNAIEALKSELGVRREFRFSDCNDSNRRRFFRTVLPFEFTYWGLVVSKEKLAAKSLCFSRPFLQYPVMGIFAQMAERMDRATVVIDRTGSSDFRKDLAKNLKNEMNAKFGRIVIHKVKDEESHRHYLLQLADIVCGALTRSYDHQKKWHNEYRQMIAQKEVAIIDWP